MSQSSDSGRIVPPLNECDHVRGSLTAIITLMEYGDYQCLECGQAHRTIKTIQQQLGEQLCFVFRHFPQPQHLRAQRVAESAEAAAAQGKFWQMHDTLFDHQQALEDADLVEYAVALDLDIAKFLQDFSARVYRERVQADIESGRSYGVEATPTFFISIRHQGTQNLGALLMKLLEVSNGQST
jgi:protein-disulfide isomerase